MRYLVNFISLVGIMYYYNQNPFIFGLCSGIFLSTLIMILKEVQHGKKE